MRSKREKMNRNSRLDKQRMNKVRLLNHIIVNLAMNL